MSAQSQIVEVINLYGLEYFNNSVSADFCQGKISAAMAEMKEPTWECFQEWRETFYGLLPETTSDEARRKRFERLYKAAGVTAPKSTEPAALEKAAQRQKKAQDAIKAYEGQSDAQLADAIRKIKAADPAADTRKQEAELKRRAKLVASAADGEKKALRLAAKAAIERLSVMKLKELLQFVQSL